MNLWETAKCLSQRLSALFLQDKDGTRPIYNGNKLFQSDPNFRDHILFFEYFNGDSGAGLAPATRRVGPAWWRNCCNRADAAGGLSTRRNLTRTGHRRGSTLDSY